MNADPLPSFCKARILILGVGNPLFGDDGFGPAVADTLLCNYIIPEEICVMDVGTGIRKLLLNFTLSDVRPEEIVIVDAVDWDQEKGRVMDIPVDELPMTNITDFSLHQVPTSNLLRKLQDQCAVKVNIFACDVGNIPQGIQPGLSPLIQEAVTTTSQKIAERFSMIRLRFVQS